MFTFQGIAVDSYVSFTADCAMKTSVCGDEIEVTLGHLAGSLHLYTDKAGLAKLVAVGRAVLAQVEATPEGSVVDLEMTPDQPTAHPGYHSQ